MSYAGRVSWLVAAVWLVACQEPTEQPDADAGVGLSDGGTLDAGVSSSGWRFVGAPGFSPGIATKTALAVHDGTPWVAFADQSQGNKLVAWRFSGGAWAQHGALLTDAAVGEVTMHSCGGKLYLAYRLLKVPAPFDAGFVFVLEQDTWKPVGGQLGGSQAWSLTMACAAGAPVIAWSEALSGALVVAKWDGAAWVPLGGAHGLWANVGIGLAVDGQGAVHVAVASGLENNRLAVRRFDAASVTPIGDALITTQGVGYVALAFDGATPVVASLDLEGLSVRRFEQGAWRSLGSGLLTAEGERADLPRLVTSDGAWLLARSSAPGFSHGATVSRVGATLDTLGGVFTPHTAGEPSLAVSGGKPFVAFQDWAHDKKLSVMTRD